MAIPWLLAGGAVGCGAGSGGNVSGDPVGAPVPLAFADVTLQAGLPRASGACAAFRDLDGDDRADIVLSLLDDSSQFGGQLAVLRNKGDGTFEKRLIATSLQSVGACEIVDLDGDGDADIVVEESAWSGGSKFLWLQNSGAHELMFTEHPLAAPKLARMHEFGFFDYDNDGQLDMFQGSFNLMGLGPNVDRCDAMDPHFQCYLKEGSNTPIAPAFLHGLGGGQFEPSPLAGGAGQNNAVAFIDWDGDGFVDVFQSNDFGVNYLLLNNGGRSLRDMLSNTDAAPYNHGMGVAFADFNRDGMWDFYSAEIGPDQLYLGRPGGGVTSSTAAAGLADITRLHSGWAPIAEDFNNDGWTDLYVLNTALVSTIEELTAMVHDGVARTQARQEDFALASEGAMSFVNTRVPHREVHSGQIAEGAAASADYDGDGRLDLLVVSGGRGELRLLHNETDAPAAHWLDVRLETRTGNTSGRGAIVFVKDGEHELGRRAVGAKGHRMNSSLDAHFGLGAHTNVQLSVRWPGGLVQEVAGPVKIDSVVVVQRP